MNDTGTTQPSQSDGHTPYSRYVQTEVLHTLQEFVSDSPAEPAFLANVQISEIYWALITRELVAAQTELRHDRIAATNRILRRIVSHMEAFNANWRSLSWLTPAELMPILKGLSAKHGKDTALQGWTFREMTFLLGVKDRPSLEHFEPQPQRHLQLTERLNSPSLYDDILAALARDGKPIPENYLKHDYAKAYKPSKEIEAIWAKIYRRDDPADQWRSLAELLADIAVEFTNWKYLHLMATRRTFGSRPAYHGVDAIQWLLPTMEEVPFPEVWTARGLVS
ncbi:tryptophan 2,3-dioxygenase family protein [Rhizobium leguminosarum]|uniref:tryptophan 2,3-dioxygenase family protein n=1 Tax=Rhizobium leguminosarum TaxID=384 RepID=UPI00103A5481|nr:tryptophan 2,3-dioxygenase family protein [Rhizobium leguminosarum]MBB4344501.1 tryptophan 2,3-dioxygenase [Rhizobium leguminosarum]MBB6297573.1 tryptophan 2,3-dioxygenase [Rhizobium leguminosarum]TCA52910.1 tryptophan 2,3-dioxygenase [Rhizobium leguminosarum bv. viciae]TCA68263.1 tryptophan 2,3-dioxygenase [Rhizobium leguminosarum bv. viciae]